MDKPNSWSAASEDLETPEDRDLSAIAGAWNDDLQVTVTFPAVVSLGPVVKYPMPQD